MFLQFFNKGISLPERHLGFKTTDVPNEESRQNLLMITKILTAFVSGKSISGENVQVVRVLKQVLTENKEEFDAFSRTCARSPKGVTKRQREIPKSADTLSLVCVLQFALKHQSMILETLESLGASVAIKQRFTKLMKHASSVPVVVEVKADRGWKPTKTAEKLTWN